MTSGWCTALLLTRSTVSSFWLHTIDSLVRALDKDAWMTDRDVGNVFLNFQLHRTAVPFPGVDLSSLHGCKGHLGWKFDEVCDAA